MIGICQMRKIIDFFVLAAFLFKKLLPEKNLGRIQKEEFNVLGTQIRERRKE